MSKTLCDTCRGQGNIPLTVKGTPDMVHLSQLSHVVTIVPCGRKCVMWSQLSYVVTIVTCGHNCHMWSQLSHVITIVTCDHNCHMWSQLSHEVTIGPRSYVFPRTSKTVQGTRAKRGVPSSHKPWEY